MNYHIATAELQSYFISQFGEGDTEFQNVSLDSNNLESFSRFSVRFGPSASKTLIKGFYRQVGVVIITRFVKPGIGVQSLMVQISEFARAFTDKVIPGTLRIVTQQPEFSEDPIESGGFVWAQVSVPFYYDLENFT